MENANPGRKAPVKYSDPDTGSTWSGRGLMPKWLKAKMEEGRKLSEFEASQPAGEQSDADADHEPEQAADAPASEYDEPEAEAAAELFLIGNLMTAAKRRFTELAVPWRELREDEQSRVLRNLADDVRLAVGQAVRTIASHERLSFRAEVESVQFKGASDIKAVLKLIGGPESHALADSAGGFVSIVIEDVTQLLDIPASATKGEPEQKTLFDASTEGTALDTQPEAAEA